MDILSPDDVSSLFNNPFVALYWPLILGGLILFVFLVKGWNKSMLLFALLFGGLQAWHMGLI